MLARTGEFEGAGQDEGASGAAGMVRADERAVCCALPDTDLTAGGEACECAG